jgi:hypothetical protein
MSSPALLSPSQYGAKHGMSASTVLRLIQDGRLPAERTASGRYLIPAMALPAHNDDTPRGRPRRQPPAQVNDPWRRDALIARHYALAVSLGEELERRHPKQARRVGEGEFVALSLLVLTEAAGAWAEDEAAFPAHLRLEIRRAIDRDILKRAHNAKETPMLTAALEAADQRTMGASRCPARLWEESK